MTKVAVASPPKTPQLVWVDHLKAISLTWIFLNHLAEQLFGGPYLANPSPNWVPLRQRIAQLAPLQGHGALDIPANVLRYVGWGGDLSGVQLFLIVSGFGLTWSLVNTDKRRAWTTIDFYKRRLARIYPQWIAAHCLFAALGAFSLCFGAPSPVHASFWLSLVGIRVFPSLLYAFSPAWWFFGLLIQLYLVYPGLWSLLRRWGPSKFFLWTSAAAFAMRLVGLLLFHDYVDAWNRGAIFITQLPGFVFGMALAVWMAERPDLVRRWVGGWRSTLVGVLLYLVGNAMCLSLVGMAVSPFLIGLGALVALWPALTVPAVLGRPLTWIGRHSLSLFLVHHVALMQLGPHPGSVHMLRALIRLLAVILATVLGALFLERAADYMTEVFSRAVHRFGVVKTIAMCAGAALLALSFLVAAELAVRRFDPQEVLGWGELPSLQTSDQFGWNLKPSQTTRLRWLSYDYTVRSNHLGFPGTAYGVEKRPHTLRILTTGDAYTSAEGVSTEQAWPRLLEAHLARRLSDSAPEVMNFAITGYGPMQEEAVLEYFVPKYRPDIVILEMFINDYDDELNSSRIWDSSGVDNPEAQVGIKGILQLTHLAYWVESHVGQLKQSVTRRPNGQASFFSGLSWLRRDSAISCPEVRGRVRARLARMNATARSVGAELLVIMVPAAVQVCELRDLSYLPWRLDRLDDSLYDFDAPQRFTLEMCRALGVRFVDLRPVLRAQQCVYQPKNLHWLPEGHERVARFLAEYLQGASPNTHPRLDK